MARQTQQHPDAVQARRRGATLTGRLVAPALALAACLAAPACALAQPEADADFHDKLLALGTGTEGGAFWPIGESLCRQLNLQRAREQVRCVASPTAGSVYNLNAVAHGRLQLGIAQEDLVLDHVAGRRGPGFDGLRLVAVLHDSPVSVVVRSSLGVQQLAQIKGLRINMGNRGSGQFTVSTALVAALGLQERDFAAVLNEPTSAFERIFCGGRVDVVLEIVPHPVAVFEKLLACGGRLVDLPPAVVQALVDRNPAFRAMAIPAGTYAGQTQAIRSVGVRNLLVSHARVSPVAIAKVGRVLAAQAEALKADQPLLATMPVASDPTAPLPAAASQAAPTPSVRLHDGLLQAQER